MKKTFLPSGMKIEIRVLPRLSVSYFQIETALGGLPNPPLDLAIRLERFRSTDYTSPSVIV
jgi:hypothetical protein